MNAKTAASKSTQSILDSLPKKTPAQKRRAMELLRDLREHYGDAHCELNYSTPHELLVATILSAQATDAGVNRVTPALFERFPTPKAFADATPEEIEPYIRSLGFFRSKARSVHEAMKSIVEEFGGEVPRHMDDLLKLRGVARKTANVVLGNAYGINEGIPVDTHVIRLAGRFGLSKETDPRKIERDLMALFPQDSWCDVSHMLIWHGRRVCKARGGLCHDHPLCLEYCSNARRTETNARKPKNEKAKGGSPRPRAAEKPATGKSRRR